MTVAEAIVIASAIIAAAWIWSNERGACLWIAKERLGWKLKREHDEWEGERLDARSARWKKENNS